MQPVFLRSLQALCGVYENTVTGFSKQLLVVTCENGEKRGVLAISHVQP